MFNIPSIKQIKQIKIKDIKIDKIKIDKIKIDKIKINPKILLIDFIKTLLTLILATGICMLLVKVADIKSNVFGVYMLAVTIISIITKGYIWGILASVVGVMGVNFFFTFPYFAINFTMTGYPLTFFIMLIISAITGALMAKVKKQALMSHAGEQKAEALYIMNRNLLATKGMNNIIDLALDYYKEIFLCNTIYFLNDPLNKESVIKNPLFQKCNDIFMKPGELETVHRVFLKKTMQGFGIDAESLSQGTYVPIISGKTVLGVVGFHWDNIDFLESETITFLNIMTSQLTLAMERQLLADEQEKILIETEKEKMRSNLLRAISHDLRTPLTSILGASGTLLENEKTIEEHTKITLLKDINQDAQWLIHMVENLLSVTRINGENQKVKKTLEAVEEVIAETVTRLKKRFPDIHCFVKVPDDFLMIPMDATLIEQVLTNLIENSIRHGKSRASITISVETDESYAIFEVYDKGIGICEDFLPTIFDGKMHKLSGDSTRGLGIGLSICKTIINAHDGMIVAENNIYGGATFRFTLPLE